MYPRIILNLLLVVILALIQISFIKILPLGLEHLNLILIILIYLLGLIGLESTIIIAIGFGLILDIFSFSAFGMFTLSFCLTVITANFILIHFFTNRSLYSYLGLIVLATLVYELIIVIIVYIFSFFDATSNPGLFTSRYFYAKGLELIMNVFASLILFYFIHYFVKSLRPVFILKPRR